MIFANDNLVGGAIVGESLLATTVVGIASDCLAATSFTCLFLVFGLRFSTPVTVA
jgi:hypothetical protein